MKKILFAVIILAFFSCKSFKDVNKKSDEIIITYDKKSGRGINPTYSLVIYESGKAYLNGIKNIDKIGEYQSEISKVKLKVLKQRFLDVEFFNFEDEYTSQITDLPTIYISFSHSGKTKKIRDYYGSSKKLKDLEMLIESIVDEIKWERISE